MGKVAAKAQLARRARRRELVAEAAARRLALEPERVALERRIDAAVAEVLAARRLRESAVALADEADQATAAAVVKLREERLSLAKIARLCGIPRTTLARLLTSASCPQTSTELSLGPPNGSDSDLNSSANERNK